MTKQPIIARAQPSHAKRAEAFLRTGIFHRARVILFAAGIVFVFTPRIGAGQTVISPNAAAAVKPTGRATLIGRVVDRAGNVVAGVEINIKDSQGNLVRTLRTNEIGRYCDTDLPLGQYVLTQNPARPAFEGQSVVANLPAEGLYVDWRVATNSAIAIATTLRDSPACTQFLAGDSLLEKVIGIFNGQTYTAGSIAGAIGLAAGAANSASRSKTVSSPSQ